MAIKVNGTTVIDNSRNFTNIAGGFKTVNGTSVVGSGNISAGASTTGGAVGTYTYGRPQNGTTYSIGSTASNLKAVAPSQGIPQWHYQYNYWVSTQGITSMSGTWRAMSPAPASGDYSAVGIWVRIS